MDGEGWLLIAGRGGIGEGERPYLVNVEGDPGALELNEDLRDEASIGGGGNMNAGVLLTDVAGVKGAASLLAPEAELCDSSGSAAKTEESKSLVVEDLRNIRGRVVPCVLGVRE